MRGRVLSLVLLLTPVLLAAAHPLADPTGDAAPCFAAPTERGAGTDRGALPDLVSAEGQITELGTSARWILTFEEPIRVPDPDGRPFRVDVVLRDPNVPTVEVSFYRDLNRIVRFDATPGAAIEVLLLPERGRNVFTAPMVQGRRMTIQVPGRILSADEDLTGTSPGLAQLRWSVIVRDEGTCDLLGDGRPSERLDPEPTPPSSVVPPVVPPAVPPGTSSPGVWAIGALVVALGLAGAGALVARRYRHR